MNITGPLLLLVGGLAFGIGFLAGTAVFSRILRQRERRVSRKIAALEYLRHRERIAVHPVVDALIDEEHQERAADRPRRWRWSR